MENKPRVAVKNANRDKVVFYIDKLKSENALYCQCERCRLDAIALALNTLPPHYFVEVGHNRGGEAGSPWILIEIASREALDKVHINPHHKASSVHEAEELSRRIKGY